VNHPMGDTPLSLHARLWLIASLAVVVLPHLFRFPVVLGAFCVAAIGWRLLRDLRGWELPGKPASTILTLAALGGVIGIYGTVFGHEAGAALLVVMLCLKLIEVRTLRDGMVVVMLGYFVVVSGFLFDQSIFVGAYLFSVAALLTAALIALNHPGGSAGKWRGYLRLSGTLLVQALPLMLALFVLFPRISGSLWGLAAPEETGQSGLSEDMEMGSMSRLLDSEEVAFRAEFPRGTPPAERLYWRGPVLWHTDGRHWTGLSEAQTERVGRTYHPLGEPVPYRITLEPHQQHWLLALDYPGKPPGTYRLTPGWQLLSKEKVEKRRRLELNAFPAPANRPLPEKLRQWALTLPPEKNPRTQALGSQWRAAGMDPRELVQRAMTFFREGPFVYTKEPPRLGRNAVDQFLFESRRGYCEHFAASFTTLMRTAGVPARVVTGYQGGEENSVGKFLVVRQSDAHAWSEVYLPREGWVRVDPTSAIPAERVDEGIDSTRFETTRPSPGQIDSDWLVEGWRLARQSWDAINHGWNLWVLGYGSRQQQRLLEKLGLGDLGWRGLVGILGLTLVAGLGGIALVVLRKRTKQDPAVAAWQQFCNKLARNGLTRKHHEGPRDFGRRSARSRPGAAAEIERIVSLYEAVRYADPRTGTGHRKLAQLRKAIGTFRPRQ